MIQEVANVQTATVHHGAARTRWVAPSEKRLVSDHGRGILEVIPKRITTIYNQPRHTTSDLGQLLLSTAHSEAADPRDRVFALLGLLADAAAHQLTADYTLTVPTVFTKSPRL